MKRTRTGLRATAWVVALGVVSQLGCVGLPEDFWVNKFGEIVNGAILSVFDPLVDNLVTTPINNVLGGV